MTDTPAAGWPHPQELCAGLVGGCGECIGLYLAAIGGRKHLDGRPPGCMACDGRHWPWQRHGLGEDAARQLIESDRHALAMRERHGCWFRTGTCWCPGEPFRYEACAAPAL